MLHWFKTVCSTLTHSRSQRPRANDSDGTLCTTPAGAPLWLTLHGEAGRPELRFLGVRDNGGETFDRYEAGFEVTLDSDGPDHVPDIFGLVIGPSGNHPMGVCMHVEGFEQDVGEAVAWGALPAPVQHAILGEFGFFRASRGYQLLS